MKAVLTVCRENGFLLLIIMVLLAGCTSTASNTTKGPISETATKTTTDIAAVLTAVVSPTSQIVVDPEFSDRELDASYDDSTAIHVTLDGSNIQVSGDGATASGGYSPSAKKGFMSFPGI